MKDEILNYVEMCTREHRSLQRGMNFEKPPGYGIILMSRRPNAPYQDDFSSDEDELFYEGHDAPRQPGLDPKLVDQPRRTKYGKPTQNGLFADWADHSNEGSVERAIVRVYEKLIPGIWSDKGLFDLLGYRLETSSGRRVFKFHFRQSNQTEIGTMPGQQSLGRQIPSWVKQEVYRRDGGCCVLCGEKTQLHFDHDFPYSKGGASVTPQNVRILCARHNLEKSDKIE